MPELSVVICTVNRAGSIGHAVRSVLEGTPASAEVVVVDQSRDSSTRDAIRPLRTDPRLRYVHLDRVGLSTAYNAGIAATTGEILAFTDDDCTVGPEWGASVLAAFRSNPDVDLLYGQVVRPPSADPREGVIPTLEFEQRRRLSRRDGFAIYGMGANFAGRRALFERLGGFDEVLGGGGPLRSSQDFDLQFRAYRAGAVCLLEPSVRVIHYGLREHDRWAETLTAYGVGDGGFYMKHVRCGDLTAFRILAGRLAREAGRVAIKPLLRRQHSSAYLRGMLRGLRQSFNYSVDRGPRVYAVRPAREP